MLLVLLLYYWKLSGKYGQPERPVKDKNGKTIIAKEEQLSRWAEHFEELLNRPTPANHPPRNTAS